MRIAIFLVSIVTLCACTGSPETTEHFETITRLELCPGSEIRNVNAEAEDRSPGFDSVYIVDVMLPKHCVDKFYQQFSNRVSFQCNVGAQCSGNDSNGDFLGIEPNRRGFRVTYST